MNVLFVHGFLGDKHIGSRLLKYLSSSDIMVSTVTLPGHAGSPLGSVKSIADFAKSVHSDSLDFIQKPYIIAGFSLGGMVALRYSELYKDDPQLKGVVIWSSPVFGYVGSLSKLGSWFFTVIPESLFSWLQNSTIVRNFLAGYGVNIVKTNKNDLREIIKIIKTDFSFDFSTAIRKLFIFKDFDDIVLIQNYKKLLKVKSINTEIELIHNIGHAPSDKVLKFVAERIAKFCRSLVN